MNATELEFRPISAAGGAEVRGIDLRAEQSEAVKERLRAAFDRYLLLLFRDQHLNAEQQLRVGEIFGSISDQGDAPGGINYVSNTVEAALNPNGELDFHFDHSFHETPLKGIMLYAIEVPPEGSGGDTKFSNSHLAYELVPEATKSRVAGMKARYIAKARPGPPRADHPILRNHPRTNEPILFLSRRHAEYLVDVEPAQQEEILDELSSYINDPAIGFSHVWRPNDLVIWDNMALQHARTDFDPSFRRHLRRSQIA
jgi:taurine dioxygenase